jgi:L-asparagine oxygenase
MTDMLSLDMLFADAAATSAVVDAWAGMPPVVRFADLSSTTTPSAAPLFVVAQGIDERGAAPADLDALAGRLAAGARIAVFVAPDSVAALSSLSGLTAGEPILHPSALDPLVASTDALLIGRGPLDGLHLTVGDAIALRGDGEVLATDSHDDAVVLSVPRPHGSLVVVGSVSPLTERLLGSRDNLAFITWLATGAVDTEVAARIAASHEPVRPHRAPAVIKVSGMQPFASPGVPFGDPGFVRAAGRARRLLPAEVHDALIDFSDEPDPAGALLLKGMPVGRLSLTPSHPTEHTDKDDTSEMTLLTVARALGQPIGYLPEHGGDIVQNIVPTKGAATTQTSTSSAVELMYHTEAAFHPHRPRYLLLLCLRGDPSAATTLSSIHEVARQLPLGARATLFEPRFRTAADESYVGRRPTQLGLPIPVLSGDWDRPSMVFDADLMVGIDDEADAALRYLADAVVACHTSTVLEPGDLLVVDNSVAVHGRTPFTPRFDGTDRWLQRTFVVADLSTSGGDRTGRVVTTRFTV